MDAALHRPTAAKSEQAGIPHPLIDDGSRQLAGIVSAIVAHRSLPSTMQRIADAFVAQYPGLGIAVFVGPMFRLEAEAGLEDHRVVQRMAGTPAAALGSAPDSMLGLPAFQEILATGVKLRAASPLICSSGETRGAIAVFGQGYGCLDDAARETLESLSDLARLAIEHRELHEEVLHRSQYDRLTGLPNRLLLEDRLRQAMVIARRQGTLLGVCCINLDRFKQINESLGLEAGDAFFKLVSERLHGSIREIDTLARHVGDEFILALRDLAETSDAVRICDRLLSDLSTPFLVAGRTLTITASIGISFFPDHGDTPDQLLSNADLALQAAKRDGRGQSRVYSQSLGQESRRASEMLEALGHSGAHAQFRVVYQPIYTMDREILGFEALLRWKHPKWGSISPLEFIPLAEKSGLIVSIGDWVIDEVCRQAMEWNAVGVLPAKIFVNISGVQLARDDFASKIAKALERSGLAPERLELEITESWIISDLGGAAGKLQQLRDLGVGIAIDDFGSGYSTFNYLQELPLDMLKIDRSFIHRLDGSAANLSTVRAIVGLAQQLGLKTVAEGVETEQNLSQLREIGCDLMQGFFLASPLEPKGASSLFLQQHSLVGAAAPPGEVSPACLARYLPDATSSDIACPQLSMRNLSRP
jgi:diguanylate cyclase (GGDEF)-like protein